MRSIQKTITIQIFWFQIKKFQPLGYSPVYFPTSFRIRIVYLVRSMSSNQECHRGLGYCPSFSRITSEFSSEQENLFIIPHVFGDCWETVSLESIFGDCWETLSVRNPYSGGPKSRVSISSICISRLSICYCRFLQELASIA